MVFRREVPRPISQLVSFTQFEGGNFRATLLSSPTEEEWDLIEKERRNVAIGYLTREFPHWRFSMSLNGRVEADDAGRTPPDEVEKSALRSAMRNVDDLMQVSLR